jgi:hypothetical protein
MLFNKKTSGRNSKEEKNKSQKTTNNGRQNVWKKSRQRSRPDDSKFTESKTFKPSQEKLKESLQQKGPSKIIQNFSSINKPSFKFNFPSFKPSADLKDFSFFNILNKLNSFLGKFAIVAILISLIYLTFFDTYFLIKTYSFTFADKSYLSETELQKLSDQIKYDKFVGIIPNNQYWYTNERILTQVGKKAIPEIEKITLERRIWPNHLVLKVQSRPILVTLEIKVNNQTEFWRISQEGRVITQDKAGIYENLVTVEAPVSFTQNQSQTNFQQYSLERDEAQINKLWSIIWLWERMEEYGIEVKTTRIPSITDTEVIIVTKNNTRLYFDSNTAEISKTSLRSRMQAFFESDTFEVEKQGGLAYIDFRISNKRIYFCRINTGCQNQL